MMILRSAPPSPYGRKVKLAAAVLGLIDRIEVVPADTNDESEPLRAQNPLGKIPTLILENGTTLFDSRVIVEYLDHLAGGGRVLPGGSHRFEALRAQALADGIMDAAILRVYETRWREEGRRDPRWLDHQAGKIGRALDQVAQTPPPLAGVPDVGAIATACALGYLDLRFEGTWREGRPDLVAWLDAFARAVPAFEATRVAA